MSLKLDTVKKFFSFPFHPLLFAAFPVLFLYSYNIEETTLPIIFKPLAFILAGAAVFLFFANLVFRSWKKSAIFTSLVVLITFFHGHVHDLVGALKYRIWKFEFGTDDTLLMVWSSVSALVFFALLRTKRDLGRITVFLNLVALLLVLQSAVTAVPHEIGRLWTLSRSNEQEGVAIQDVKSGGSRPDIYYIVLDRYASNETLSELYDFDNQEFTTYLKEAGFYVAEESVANYPRTLFSLASSLNMTYFEPTDKFLEPLQNHELGRFLKSQGYRYLHIGSWAGPTSTSPIADVNFEVGEIYLDLDEFSLKLFQTTALAPLVRKIFPETALFDFDVQHRNRVFYQLDRLKEIPKTQPSPKFVFAHLLLPHDPYVFDSNCGKREATEDMIADYLLQLSCTNLLVEETVGVILEDSAQPPVIVIQGDEGPLDWVTLQPMKYPFVESQSYQDSDPRSLQERAGVLNSYYLPGVDVEKVLYPSVTPVNTFRLVLNLYFGTDLELLPDKSYIFQETGNLYDVDKHPLKFIDVTDRLR